MSDTIALFQALVVISACGTALRSSCWKFQVPRAPHCAQVRITWISEIGCSHANKMVQYIINPWPARRELFKVRDEFYPPTTTTSEAANSGRRHAVALVSVWMQRGACPHLVESTALLTSAILDDVPGATAYSVRATYSTAICR